MSLIYLLLTGYAMEEGSNEYVGTPSITASVNALELNPTHTLAPAKSLTNP